MDITHWIRPDSITQPDPRRPMQKWAFVPLAIVHHVLAFAPLLCVLLLYLLSWRTALLLGHTPRPYIDPVYMGDELFDALGTLLTFLAGINCFALLIPFFSIVFKDRYARF